MYNVQFELCNNDRSTHIHNLSHSSPSSRADGKVINDAAPRNFAERKRSPATITFLRRLRISVAGTVIYIVREGKTIFQRRLQQRFQIFLLSQKYDFVVQNELPPPKSKTQKHISVSLISRKLFCFLQASEQTIGWTHLKLIGLYIPDIAVPARF